MSLVGFRTYIDTDVNYLLQQDEGRSTGFNFNLIKQS